MQSRAMLKNQIGVSSGSHSIRRSLIRGVLSLCLGMAYLGTSVILQPAHATARPATILSDIGGGRYVPDPASCKCEVDQSSAACPPNLADLLPGRFRLMSSTSYGPGVIGSPTAMGDIRFYPAKPKYSTRYEMKLSEAMGQIVNRKTPVPNPILRTVEHKRQFDATRAVNSYRETYRQNGAVLAVVSHGWEFKKLSPTQMEFKNYDQSEEYADIDSSVPHSIPIIRIQAVTCVVNRR
jgi:hypothetical protein